MTTSIVPVRKGVDQQRPPLFSGLYRSAVLGRLELLRDGRITIIENGETRQYGQ